MRTLLGVSAVLMCAACTKDDPGKPGRADPHVPPAWDEEAAPIDCSVGDPAPLFDALLDDAGLSRDQVGYTQPDLDKASYAAFLDDPFLLPWFRPHFQDPLQFSCMGGQLAADLDHAAATAHPVATALGEAFALLDHPLADAPPDPAEAMGGIADLSALPADLADALVPILHAMTVVAEAREIMEGDAPANTNTLIDYGHGGVMIDFESAPDLTDADAQDWVLGDTGPRALFGPARALAFAIEHADLSRFAGTDAELDVDTDLGRVIVAGPGSDEPGDIGRVALYLDLGGDDVYLHEVAASSKRVPAAVHIDLGGADTYSYEPTGEGTDALLPADEDGRYGGDAYFGPVSLSRVGRQGSGRFGVGLLFDLGGDGDHYQSLRVSQGWAHLGVGVLFDDGGDDTYLAEAGAQGAAAMGVGLLMDVDGNDIRNTFTDSHGFAYVQGVGIAWDGGGDDTWYADPGKAEDGGTTLYYSPQLPNNGNSGFSQGAGFGMRNDAASTFLSGGIGVLRDVSGDDRYTAGTFAQGSGYWQGTGMLLDGDGHDQYDAYYYVQGGAAHYAVGVLMDDGDGNDALNTNMDPNYMHFGAGHDFSVGLFVNEGGDDTYVYAGLAAGASNCQGIGLMVDNDGADTYTALSDYSTGLGNHSGECESGERATVHSIGLFVDSGGDDDTYDWPFEGDRAPDNGSTFGVQWNGTDDEFGGGVDGDGETGVHASGIAP